MILLKFAALSIDIIKATILIGLHVYTNPCGTSFSVYIIMLHDYILHCDIYLLNSFEITLVLFRLLSTEFYNLGLIHYLGCGVNNFFALFIQLSHSNIPPSINITGNIHPICFQQNIYSFVGTNKCCQIFSIFSLLGERESAIKLPPHSGSKVKKKNMAESDGLLIQP